MNTQKKLLHANLNDYVKAFFYCGALLQSPFHSFYKVKHTFYQTLLSDFT